MFTQGLGNLSGVPGPKSQLGKNAEEQGQGPQSVDGIEHESNALLGSTDSGINFASLAKLRQLSFPFRLSFSLILNKMFPRASFNSSGA